ncbi:MAG: hypothetical protein GY771_03130 [bacterium]|nr:hypothetical protein [bacterium]
MMTRKLYLVFFATLLLTAFSGAIDINQQNISTDTHWTRSGSPYVVNNDLTITNNATLTIDGGVEIKFRRVTSDGGYEDGVEIVVRNGALICDGSKYNPVVFTSNETNPTAGDWGAIVVEYNNQFILNYTNIEYAKTGLWLYHLSSSGSSSSSTEYMEISDCSDNGVFAYYSYLDLYHAVIKNNGYAGVKTSGPCYVTVHNSDLKNNGSYDFYNGSSRNIDATNCWWGTTSSGLIASQIYDYYDNGGYGIVDYTPYLSGSFTDGGSVSTFSFGYLKGFFMGD